MSLLSVYKFRNIQVPSVATYRCKNKTKRRIREARMIFTIIPFSLSKIKRRHFYLKTQSVPRNKHFSSRL